VIVTDPLLSLKGIDKSFGALRALEDVSLDLHPGEVHALMGENGAGKSTLVRVLAGVHRPDNGTIVLAGEAVEFGDPAAARDAGIAVIYQEPTLFGDLSVTENVFMGRQPLAGFRRIDRKSMRTQVQQLFARLGVALDPDRLASGLSIADQQMVEIAKALSLNARVIVMDEPTAALSTREVERLFTVARALRAEGAALLFITHRLTEVYALCDRVTVLRDGRFVSTDLLTDVTEDELIRRMVGRDLGALFPKITTTSGEVALTVSRLTREGVFTDVSFTVRAGEIVALAGLVGSGRSEVARAVFGIDRYDAGSVTAFGKQLRKASPVAAISAGLALVPEDRRQQGLVMELSIERNATMTQMRALSRFGLLSVRAERRRAKEWATRLQLKYVRLSDAVGVLSGGNQQKVVLAKWLATRPKVLIVDEPTRGIDVGTKAEVHRLLSELAGEGVAVLMISSELPEVLGMADRILVMREGRLVAEIDRADATEETVLSAAVGRNGLGAAS
jgi:rhamnose transport system ATP-binding protein